MWVQTQDYEMFNIDKFIKINMTFDESTKKFTVLGSHKLNWSPIKLASYVDEKQAFNVYSRLRKNIFDNTNFDFPNDYTLNND